MVPIWLRKKGGTNPSILKSFSPAFTRSTCILHLAMFFVAAASLSVNFPCCKKGGILTETPEGIVYQKPFVC